MDVILMSTYSSAQPVGQCRCYDKKQKAETTILKTSIAHDYNRFTVGVDLMAALLPLYKIHVRLKRYYYKVSYHSLNGTVANSSLLYTKD